ncbi:MAG: large conductance mechanosensitive channel protein MscL [Oscillospiraceae bacterium]|nr:large conductance mechanosensitive channel protein MscL [Oscillospiraceae bacterium]
MSDKKIKAADIEKKAGGLIHEFKEFISKGNVMNLAVGVIIGAAFQNIVTALTSSFINPLIALITGGCEKDEAGNLILVGGQFTVNGVSFDYGSFISAVLNFLIMALILFVMIKAVNKLMSVGKKKEEEKEPEPEPAPDPQIVLLSEIRDLLKDGKVSEAEEKLTEKQA